jgi:hypothetical protein
MSNRNEKLSEVLLHEEARLGLIEIDRIPRYAPSEIICKGIKVPVLSYHVWPVGQHPEGCVLIEDCVALELRTVYGSRWFGCENAWINSELRMVVVGFPARDEVRRTWKECKVRG